jgi:hypothetical protein
LVAGLLTVKVSVDVPPTVNAPLNALFNVGTAAVTETQAPVALVPPPAALLAMAAVMFVVAEI